MPLQYHLTSVAYRHGWSSAWLRVCMCGGCWIMWHTTMELLSSPTATGSDTKKAIVAALNEANRMGNKMPYRMMALGTDRISWMAFVIIGVCMASVSSSDMKHFAYESCQGYTVSGPLCDAFICKLYSYQFLLCIDRLDGTTGSLISLLNGVTGSAASYLDLSRQGRHLCGSPSSFMGISGDSLSDSWAISSCSLTTDGSRGGIGGRSWCEKKRR